MSTAVVNAFNIFVDSGRYLTSQSTGDNIHLPLSDTPISCADNQYLRLTLQDFNMNKNFPNVNSNNSVFRIVYNGTPTSTNLTHKNYKNVLDIATDFADVFAAAVVTAQAGGLTATTKTIISPPAKSSAYGNTDNVISFSIVFSATIAHNPVIQFRITDGDIYELLGGDKITDTADLTTASVTCVQSTTTNSNDTLTVTCKYPAQRFTEEHVYLRTDLPSTNLETMSYNARDNTDSNNGIHIAPSRILGKIPIGETVCQFHTSTGNEYTINLKQKNFTMMQLFLTDTHGRDLPVANRADAITKGNFNFKCTIKVETMQHIGMQNNQLQTEKPQKTVPPRFGTQPLDYLDYGGVRVNR